MTEYIEREKLMRDIEKYHVSDGKFQHWVEIQPDADVTPVRHGRWKHNVDDCWICSECGVLWQTLDGESPEENDMNFCPVCGAKMDGGNENG